MKEKVQHNRCGASICLLVSQDRHRYGSCRETGTGRRAPHASGCGVMPIPLQHPVAINIGRFYEERDVSIFGLVAGASHSGLAPPSQQFYGQQHDVFDAGAQFVHHNFSGREIQMRFRPIMSLLLTTRSQQPRVIPASIASFTPSGGKTLPGNLLTANRITPMRHQYRKSENILLTQFPLAEQTLRAECNKL